MRIHSSIPKHPDHRPTKSGESAAAMSPLPIAMPGGIPTPTKQSIRHGGGVTNQRRVDPPPNIEILQQRTERGDESRHHRFSEAGNSPHKEREPRRLQRV